MFVRDTTLYCKYGSLLITKEVRRECELNANGGKITTHPHFKSKYCTFQGNMLHNKLDCFLACP